MRNKAIFAVIATVLLCTAAWAQTQPAAVGQNPSAVAAGSDSAAGATTNVPSLKLRDPRYKIEAGDSFDIAFELNPEFNQNGVTVQPDGFVNLHGVADVKVQGQTVPQLTETLRQAYSQILNNPMISIVLKTFEKPYFVAGGQVGRPGKYDLRGDVTLTQAIAMAGGFTVASKHSQVLLFRQVNEKWLSAQIINVKKMLSAGDLHEDPYLHPGDMLFVPQNRISKISPFIPRTGVGASAFTAF